MKKLYYGKNILTMTGQNLRCDAVLTENGLIGAVGDYHELKRCADETVLLGNRTLMPSFVDPHSHITSFASTLSLVDLSGAKDLSEIKERIEKYISQAKPKPGEWVCGFGYDHNFLEEKRHPDRALLDEASPDNPLLISHSSGHMGVTNSAGLAALGLDEASPDPEGGRLGRSDGRLNGYLEETAFTVLTSKLPKPDAASMAKPVSRAEDIYFSHGVTTIQDGLTRESEWQILKYMAEQKLLRADIVCYTDLKNSPGILPSNPEYASGYKNSLRLGGDKIFLDGSPQGRTAWMSEPYENALDGYRGYPIYGDDEVFELISKSARRGTQLLAHCNGDAAAEQFITQCERASKTMKLRRPVMIHAQLLRKDQLDRMAALDMTASFFTAHTYYFGDVHLRNFGEGRAKGISPARSASERGVNVTFHQDTPVLAPNMLETVWCAVARRSREGADMGTGEQIGVYDALKAVTANAAYQYFEENSKGTLETGKRADMVLLSENPLDAPVEGLKDIRVCETIKGGEIVYKNV